MSESKTPKKKSPLVRMEKESDREYRAFLLWAMQVKNRRNKLAVSRAIGVSHTTISNWLSKHKWEKRASRQTAETEAQQLYRHLYVPKYNMSEIMAVQENIASPITGTVSQEIGSTINATLNIEKKIQKAPTVHKKELQRKQLLLLDAAIAYIAQGIKDGSIKRQMRDIPLLIQLRNELTEIENSKTNQNIVHEYLRVRNAKENNENVVEAMFEDAKELVVILGSLSKVGKAKEYLQKENKKME